MMINIKGFTNLPKKLVVMNTGYLILFLHILLPV